MDHSFTRSSYSESYCGVTILTHIFVDLFCVSYLLLDMMDRLNALQSILEVNPLTPDRLLSSLPDVNDWSQFNQLNQFCSTLFEDVSGEVFEPQTFDTPLFPDYEQKQTPLALDANFNMNLGAYNNQLGQNGANNMAFGAMPATDSIYKDILPEDTYASPATSLNNYGVPTMTWDPMSAPAQGMRIGGTPRNIIQTQQPSRFNPGYVPIQQSGNSGVKVEKEDEKVALPTVTVKVERMYADMSTQTKAKQERLAAEGGMMMMSRSSEQKKQQKTYKPIDPDNLVLPSVPDTPLDLETDELTPDELAQIEDEIEEQAGQDESRDGDVTPTATNPQSTRRFGGYVEKALAKQAAAAAASAEPLNPVDAMTLQLERTRLNADNIKPAVEDDMERQMRAAKARALCSQDPVRKQHAEVVLNLLKSIDALMVDHRNKVAQYKQAQAQAESGLAARTGVTRPGSSAIGSNGPSMMYPRAGVNVQNQGPIRTVSSYLPRRTPHQPSPLHQDHQAPSADPDYSQLRSSLTEDRQPAYNQNAASAPAADSPVLYPTSDLHHPVEEEPFELSEEERRFIEEDNAKTAAAQASGYQYVHV